MIVSTDAHRDSYDNGTHPYRVRYHESGSCGIASYIKTKSGKIKKFRSLNAACKAARALEVS